MGGSIFNGPDFSVDGKASRATIGLSKVTVTRRVSPLSFTVPLGATAKIFGPAESCKLETGSMTGGDPAPVGLEDFIQSKNPACKRVRPNKTSSIRGTTE